MFPMATVIREHLTCAFPETETMTFDDAIGHLIEQHTQMRMQAISASGVSETQALLPLDKELVLRALAEKAAGDRKAATELGLPVGVVGARLEHWADRADRLIDTLKATTVVLLVDAS